MSIKQKETEQAVKDVLAGRRTLTDAEIRDLKNTVAQQRHRRAQQAKQATARPRTTDMRKARTSTVAPRIVPGNFESKK